MIVFWAPFAGCTQYRAATKVRRSLPAPLCAKRSLSAARRAGRCWRYEGLGSVFVEPAITHLREQGVTISFEDELVELLFGNGRVSQLKFAKQHGRTGRERRGHSGSSALCRNEPGAFGLIAPDSFRGIVNAHFRIDPPAHLPPMLGVINGTCEWIFPLPGRISATISDAGRLFDMPRTELAQIIWSDIAKVAGLPDTSAALADRPRASGDIRRDAGTECAASGCGNVLEQSVSCRRLDRDRACRRRSKARSVRAIAPPILSNIACEPPHDDALQTSCSVVAAGQPALTRQSRRGGARAAGLPARRRTLGVRA